MLKFNDLCVERPTGSDRNNKIIKTYIWLYTGDNFWR